jgi:hypothetical protein
MMVGIVPTVEGDPAPAATGAGRTAIDRPAQRSPLRGPAVIVLGIAVVIVVVGLVGSAISSSNSATAPASPVHQVTLSDGTSLLLTPATTALHSIVGQGQPPADILNNLAVPAGSRSTATINNDLTADAFDQTVDFATPLSNDEVVDAFKTLLPKLGWQVLFVGPGSRGDSSGTEVLAKRGGSDGYDWEVGVVVSPTTLAGTTPFSVEVFQLTDDT